MGEGGERVRAVWMEVVSHPPWQEVWSREIRKDVSLLLSEKERSGRGDHQAKAPGRRALGVLRQPRRRGWTSGAGQPGTSPSAVFQKNWDFCLVSSRAG